MGLFSSLFGTGFKEPPREKWDYVVDRIHANLAVDRPAFFRACVEILSMVPGLSIRNRVLGRKTELGITVYQLHLGRELIAKKQYVRSAEGNAFVTMLYVGACRYGSAEERDELFWRYWPRDQTGTEGFEMLRFYSDIATDITGDETPLKEALLLCDSTINRFTIVSHLAIASAFGDADYAKELRRLHERTN
jgi:hypothetical protein